MKKLIAALFALLLSAPAFAATAPAYSPPFGMWRIPGNMQGSLPFNLTALAFDPATDTPASVIAALNTARAAKMHVFISLINFSDMTNMAARYAQWCPNHQCLALQSYVADGTLMGIHIFEYNGGGAKRLALPPNTPTLDDIQQIGTLVKQQWPGMPVAVDTAHPCALQGENWQGSVDIVMITFFTIRQSDYRRGEDLLNSETQCSQQMSLKFTIGPNPFGGIQHGLTSTSLANFEHYLEYALMYPGSVGTFVWRWWPGNTPTVTNGKQTFVNFWSEQADPGVNAAMQEIANCAASRTSSACPHGAP